MPDPDPTRKPGLPLAGRAKRNLPLPLSAHLHLSDLQGLAQLATQGTLGVAGLAEKVNRNLVAAAAAVLRPLASRVANSGSNNGRAGRRGITGLVYGSIRGVTRLVGGAVDGALGSLAPLTNSGQSSRQREAVLSALNGVLGDRLLAMGNPLAISMQFRSEGAALPLNRPALARLLPAAGPKVLVMVHGLCMNDWQWCGSSDAGHYSHEQLLSRTLDYTPIHLHYNSGRHIHSNGLEFSILLEQLLAAWPQPVQELVLLTHSMGGLVARSACFYAMRAGCRWPEQLKSLVFLGTPHHGAPLERVGGWIDTLLGSQPVTRPFASIAKVRSAGITDLRYGQFLPPDSARHAPTNGPNNAHTALPLPAGVACFAVAGTTGSEGAGPLHSAWQALGLALVGDGLVPVSSALGLHENPALKLAFENENQRIFPGVGHIALLTRPEVGQQLRAWLA